MTNPFAKVKNGCCMHNDCFNPIYKSNVCREHWDEKQLGKSKDEKLRQLLETDFHNLRPQPWKPRIRWQDKNV